MANNFETGQEVIQEGDTSKPDPFTICFVANPALETPRGSGSFAVDPVMAAPTAMHEFLHAISSYSNGSIVDLYVDSPVGINKLHGRPIPISFGTYDALSFSSDMLRDGLGYPASWSSYHCDLHNPSLPAAMDSYRLGANPNACENDRITRQFVKDRLLAKVGR